MSREGPPRPNRTDFWGWILFVLSALFFIASSLRTGDVVALLGGIFFLLACAVFLYSYTGNRKG